MIHNLEQAKDLYGEDIVDLLIRLRPLFRAAKLKETPFEDADYLDFESRHNRLLSKVPPGEQDRAKNAMVMPVLSGASFYEPDRKEIADYEHYFQLVEGDLGGPVVQTPTLFLEGFNFEIQGAQLREIANSLRGEFAKEPIPARMRSAYGTGAVRFTRTLVDEIVMSVTLFRGLPGELAVSSFLEKNDKGTWIELWTIFNFPARWELVQSEDELRERVSLLFNCANVFCDAVGAEYS